MPKVRIKLFLIIFFLFGCQPKIKPSDILFEHAIDGAYAADISYDGRFSLVSSIHHGLSLWNLEKNALAYQWQHNAEQENEVFLVDIAYGNKYAVSADRHNFVVWNIENGSALGYYQIEESSIRDVALANGGRSLLIGQGNGHCILVNLETGRRLKFLGHTEKVNSVDLSVNGRFALTGGNDYSAYLWDTLSGQVIHRFNHSSRVTHVTIDPYGRYVFTADSQNSARIWDIKTGKVVSQLQFLARQNIFSSVRFSSDGRYLATGAPTKAVVLWDIASGEKHQQWQVTARNTTQPSSAVVYSVAFIDNNQKLISESSSGLAEIWQIK